MSQISFSGLASGIDGDAIIKTMIESKRLANIPLENQITENKQETTALESFNELLLQLNSKLNSSMTLAGGSLTRSAQSSNADAVSAKANNNATVTSLTVDVSSIAKTASFSFDDRFESNTKPIASQLAEPATMSITIGTGENATTLELEIDDTTTLDGLATKIIDGSQGKLLANTVNVGTTAEPLYLLMVSGTTMGTEGGTISIDTSALVESGLFQTYNMEQATDARFTVSGIGEVVRQTNQISQLIPGMSFELKQAGTGPVKISVDVDKEQTVTKVADIIAAFNEVIKFSKGNSAIERIDSESGVSNIYGSLAKTKVDEQAIDAIRSALFSAVSTNETSGVRMYADLGITTSRDGTLAFDEEKFKKALGENPKAADEILSKFSDSVSSVNGVIYQYTSFNGQIDMATKSNDTSNRTTQQRIDRIERAIAEQEQRLRLMFANLESTISKLNSQGDALMGMISSLSAS